MEGRKATCKITPGLDEQFVTGRLYGKYLSNLTVGDVCLLHLL